MNVRIGRLYRVLAVLFFALIASVSYWQVWAAPSLATRQDNARLVYRELSVDRGQIISADGVVLAKNRAARQNGRDVFTRLYPPGGLAAHLVGYSSLTEARAGLEESLNSVLVGSDTDISGALQNLLDEGRGATVHGDSATLWLSAKAQKVALDDLRKTGLKGAVVALDPATGGVLVMASWPTFDPNDVAAAFKSGSGQSAFNNATQGLYPPGSAFKVVTGALALENGLVAPGTTFDGPQCIKTQGPKLCNFHGETPGEHTFAEALVHSYNTTFGTIGLKLGKDRLLAGMAAFGFFQRPDLDYPSRQIRPSGLYSNDKLQPQSAGIDVARTAIGQGQMGASPLQMAMVAAAIANGGVVMQPQAVKTIRAPDGSTVDTRQPHELGRAVSAATAATLRDIMRQVVDDGTGTAAQISGIDVAGKTGTAEVDTIKNLNDAWFVAFAPAAAPTVAVAVVVLGTPQTGGQIAAPIAKDVIQALEQ